MILLKIFRVEGESMLPTLESQQYIFVSYIPYILYPPKAGDIILALNPNNRKIVKRIKRIENNKVFLIGDNDSKSTDSRSFGLLEKDKIIGKVLFQ